MSPVCLRLRRMIGSARLLVGTVRPCWQRKAARLVVQESLQLQTSVPWAPLCVGPGNRVQCKSKSPQIRSSVTVNNRAWCCGTNRHALAVNYRRRGSAKRGLQPTASERHEEIRWRAVALRCLGRSTVELTYRLTPTVHTMTQWIYLVR